MGHQPQQALAERGGQLANDHRAITSRSVASGQKVQGGVNLANRFPVPALATGWFQVAYSDELAIGDVRPLRYFGSPLVLWRDRAGRPVLADAHCPHLGAHLGFGGTVTDGGLRCPLHGWLFSEEGRCTAVPGGEPPEPAPPLRTYPTIERNSLLLAWFHPAAAPPSFQIPACDVIADGTFIPLDRRSWTARTIWQEAAESILDLTHVSELHGLEPYHKHEMTEDGPTRRMSMTQPLRTHLGTVDLTMELDAVGPGYAIARFGGNLILIQAFSPIDDERLEIRFTFFGRDLGSPRRTERIGASLIADLVRQTDQHVTIWSHKAYLADPPLTPQDGPIRQFREWAAQFYVPGPADRQLRA
jgi:nitrite reductase/ring-hydroxylating ferredoxin subunit